MRCRPGQQSARAADQLRESRDDGAKRIKLLTFVGALGKANCEHLDFAARREEDARHMVPVGLVPLSCDARDVEESFPNRRLGLRVSARLIAKAFCKSLRQLGW